MKPLHIFFISLVMCSASKGQNPHADSLISRELKQKFFASKFSVVHNTRYIDTAYIQFQKQQRGHNCVGNPGDVWINTDAPSGKYCTARMSFYGRSTKDKSLCIFLFEQNLGGGRGYTFDIFEIENKTLKRLTSFTLPLRINSIKKIKQYLRRKGYDVGISYTSDKPWSYR